MKWRCIRLLDGWDTPNYRLREYVFFKLRYTTKYYSLEVDAIKLILVDEV